MNLAQLPVVMTRMPGWDDYLLLLAGVLSVFSAVVATLIVIILVVVRRRREQPAPDEMTWLKLFLWLLGGSMLATLLFFSLV